jgi:GAF domain-containing protein
MGQQLLELSTAAARRELIVRTAGQLLDAQASLWVSSDLDVMGDGADAPLASSPDTELKRRALAIKHLALDTTDDRSPGGPTALAVPLRAGTVILGALEMRRVDGHPFNSREMDLIEGLAHETAIGLQAARQGATERWRIEQLNLVRTVSAQVADVLDLDELAKHVTRLILQTFGYYYVALFITEPTRARLRRQASAGATNSRPGRVPRFVGFGEGLVGHTAESGEEILASDVSAEPRYRGVDALPETRSEIALPLKIEGRILGVLDVQSDTVDDFDNGDLLVLRALADNIAIALEDARIYSDLRRRADQLATITEVTRAMASILDQEALFEKVVSLIHERFGYPFVHLFTVDAAQRAIVYRAGSGPRSQALQQRGLVYDLEDPGGIIPWVARHGEIVLANDVLREPLYRPSELPPRNTRAELAVPLVFGTNVLGVLDVQSDRRGAFTEDERFLFETLARGVAVAIRNANLYRSERWRRQVADSLREVAGLLSTNAGLDQVLDAILTELERTLPSSVTAIWLVQDGNLCLSAVHGATADVCIRNLSDKTSPWLYEALRAERPIIRTVDSQREPLGITLDFESDYSAIAAPLRAGDSRLGLLMLAHPSPGRYGEEARGMAAAFASYAAVAIENTRLYRSAQQQAWISTVMLEVARVTQASSSLPEVLESVTRMVPMLVSVRRCAMLLLEGGAGQLVPASVYGLSPSQQALLGALPATADQVPAFRHMMDTRAPLSVANAPPDLAFPGPLLSSIGFDSPALFPLLVQGEVAGVLLVNREDQQPGLSSVGLEGSDEDDWITIIQGIAHQTAAVIENTKLRQAQQEEAYVSAALLQVAQALASLTELDDILETVARITPTLIGVERCAIYLWDDESGAFVPAKLYGVPQESARLLMAESYLGGSFPLFDQMRDTASIQVYSHVPHGEAEAQHDELVPDEFLDCFAGGHLAGSQTLLAIPLAVKSDLLGAMLVEETDGQRGSNPRRLDIITGIADQAAVAVQNDRLQREMAERARLEQELDLAREIQESLMPARLPAPPGWELAGICQPARQVGGDFFDVFELPGGKLGLVIGDVADKGMPAALFMALTRALVRAVALEVSSPTAVLSRVNELMVPDAQRGMFVTAIFAILSPQEDALALASAGHNRPILWHAHSGHTEWLSKGGLALGVLPDVQLVEHRVTMKSGDYLVFYTDGVTEAYAEERDEFFGQARLVEALRGSLATSARALVEEIEETVVAFEDGSPPFDDLTLLVVHRT